MGTKPIAIAVTGGPGGGKTTALDLFQRELKDEIRVVPESATLLFGHGLTKDSSPDNARLLQRAIYRMQVNLEAIFHEFFAERLLICDRGTLDGIAYWPDDEASFFDAIESTYAAESDRYDAVIFFETAAARGEDVRSNNPYRSESLQAARDLDERLQRVWSRHRRYHFIPSEKSFLEKIANGLRTIQSVLAAVKGR